MAEGVDVNELHIRASVWYEDNGLQIEAFHHAAAANDIERAERLIEEQEMAIAEAAQTSEFDLDSLGFDDMSVYEMISDADTIGVFQVESRAQQQVLPRLRPKSSMTLLSASL